MDASMSSNSPGISFGVISENNFSFKSADASLWIDILKRIQLPLQDVSWKILRNESLIVRF
jgi:hypothetical protein